MVFISFSTLRRSIIFLIEYLCYMACRNKNFGKQGVYFQNHKNVEVILISDYLGNLKSSKKMER